MSSIAADICVIGAGSGGLSVAAGASQMGARTVLIESHRMGGDCLNTGCVPSKSLLAAAAAAESARSGGRFGINGPTPAVDWAQVNAHVQGVIGAIAPHDSVARFEGLGVQVLQGHARFTGPQTVQAGDHVVKARRFVIATGSRAAVPPIPGLDRVPYFTNETLFENAQPVAHLIVIGAGPIGVEMAQAHRRLGAKVSLLDLGPLLPKDDPELAAVVRAALLGEGIEILEGIQVTEVGEAENGVAISVLADGTARRIAGSHLLIAAGRRPNIEDLGLEAAGIAFSKQGVTVDRGLRTTNRRVYAIGDVAGGPQFTHLASYHAGIVIRSALFRLPAKAELTALPWVTYSDPELAHVGLSEAEARFRHGAVTVLRFPFAQNDRAQAERRTEGLIKVTTTAKGKILGASIVGLHAGELILPWVLAIQSGLKIKAMASVIAPYPTLSEVSKRIAGSFYTPALFSERTRRLVRWLGWLG